MVATGTGISSQRKSIPEAHSMSLGLAEKWNGHMPCEQAGQADQQLEDVMKSIGPVLKCIAFPDNT